MVTLCNTHRTYGKGNLVKSAQSVCHSLRREKVPLVQMSNGSEHMPHTPLLICNVAVNWLWRVSADLCEIELILPQITSHFKVSER